MANARVVGWVVPMYCQVWTRPTLSTNQDAKTFNKVYLRATRADGWTE